MHIIVAGGGVLGEQVAAALREAGDTVTVVDADAGRAADLAAQGMRVVHGNACAASTLEAAGALRADVLVACTGLDDDNLVISLLARRHLEIPRVVARVNDDANHWLFDESWGVDAAISAASALVALIEEAAGSAGTVRLAEFAEHGIILVEGTIAAGSAAAGKTVAELALSPGDLVAAVLRRGRALRAAGTLRIRAGDRVLVATGPDGEKRVHRAFYPDTVVPR